MSGICGRLTLAVVEYNFNRLSPVKSEIVVLQNEVKQTERKYKGYTDIFSDVPTITHLMKHEINLTTKEPVRSGIVSKVKAVQDTVSISRGSGEEIENF